LEAVAGELGANARSVLVCESDLTINSAIEKLARRVRLEFEVLDHMGCEG
jgi:hypothetical protein